MRLLRFWRAVHLLRNQASESTLGRRHEGYPTASRHRIVDIERVLPSFSYPIFQPCGSVAAQPRAPARGLKGRGCDPPTTNRFSSQGYTKAAGISRQRQSGGFRGCSTAFQGRTDHGRCDICGLGRPQCSVSGELRHRKAQRRDHRSIALNRQRSSSSISDSSVTVFVTAVRSASRQ